MKIVIATPAPPGSRKGNRITALRWARHLRQLGHHVTVRQEYAGEACDLLVALHACRGFAAIDRFHKTYPERPVILALTGTDLYDQIHTEPNARRALAIAARLVVLQPLGIPELPVQLQSKARVIYQSTAAPRRRGVPPKGSFDVCVLGHLRPVKDPFRTALAARLLPAASRMRVLHLGAPLSAAMARRIREESVANPRYRWLGDLPRWKALRVLARCRLLVQTSLLEGGANTISEAIAASVPVISSRIPGSVGLLGADYPGYFPVADTNALAALLDRAETDGEFYRALKTSCRRLRPLVRPARERASWQRLLREVTG
jgi:putative glycosyltransferase (TIGR04348 family)